MERNGSSNNDPQSALLEFLLPRRAGQQASSFPTYALLTGPRRSGKTSLLLQLAYNLAIDASARVVVICKQENFEDDHIYLPFEMNLVNDVSDRIHIKYIRNAQDLCKYFAAFHLHLDFPTAVIIDDFVDFFGEGVGHQQEGIQMRAAGELPLVKTLCLCHNAVGYANERAGVSGLQCRLIISDTHFGGGIRLLYIFRRWLSDIFVIKALDDRSAFSLEVLQDGEASEEGNIVGRYSLANQVMHFGGLEKQLRNHMQT